MIASVVVTVVFFDKIAVDACDRGRFTADICNACPDH
jgi:hypothetical protein